MTAVLKVATKLECQGGSKCDPQDSHGEAAIPVTCTLYLLHLGLAASQGFQGRETLQDIQEISLQAAESLPLPAGEGLSSASDQQHKQRDERSRNEENYCRQQVGRQDKTPDSQRHQEGGNQTRQILAEIRV